MIIKKYIFALFILIFTFSLVSAIDYQADIIFDISETGLVEISGNSNHPLLKNHISQNYTSKKGEFWSINFSIDEIFSEYIFELKFPPNTNINYIKIPNILNIDNSNNRIIITSTAQNTKLNFLAQYSYSKIDDDNYSLVFLIPLIIILTYFIYYFKYKKSKKIKYNTNALTDRQKQIFDLIIKNKGSVTQAHLQKEINIPKASLSRNIDSLIRKNIIIKESKGMTNLISLKK